MITAFRRDHEDATTEVIAAFEASIGNAANARSWAAHLLAIRGDGAGPDRAESLARKALETWSELVRVGRCYERSDLERVRDQVNTTLQRLTL